MANLLSNQAMPIFTEQIAGMFDDLRSIKVMNFGRKHFAEKTIKARVISTAIRRGSEKLALDQIYGSQGAQNATGNYSQMVIAPFYYRQFVTITGLEPEFHLFGSDSFNINDMRESFDYVATKIKSAKETIERAQELLVWQLLETGKVTSYANPASPQTIDFNRKNASIVDLGSGEYWDTNAATCNPFADIAAGCDWLRQNGFVGDFDFEIIMGSAAYAAFINTTKFTNLATQLRNLDNDFDRSRRNDADGAVYHGNFSFLNYRGDVYTFQQYYEDPTGVSSTKLSFKNPNTVIILPKSLNAQDAEYYFTAVPQISATLNTLDLVSQPYMMSQYINQLGRNLRYDIESCCMPVMKSIDKVYTLKAHS
jgi:hypothetical protein